MFGKPFDTTFLVFLVLATAAAITCYLVDGADATWAAVRTAGGLFVFILPQFLGGLAIGGLLQTLISRQWIERSFGQASGLKGLVLASFGGAITPTGPFASFPLVFALWKAGADIGVLVTYLTAWALIGFHRVLVWEIPFMGVKFAILRLVISLPMPILAGLIARAIARRTALAPAAPEADG